MVPERVVTPSHASGSVSKENSRNFEKPDEQANVQDRLPSVSFDQISLGTSSAPFQMPLDPRFMNSYIHPSQNYPNPLVLNPAIYQTSYTTPAALSSAKRSSQTASIREKLQQKRCLFVFFLIAIVLILCAVIVLLSILGASEYEIFCRNQSCNSNDHLPFLSLVPCSFRDCSGEGLICVNTPFVCKVQCQSGYKSNVDGGCSAGKT